MSRDRSPELQAHLDSGITTTTLLMKIVPQRPGLDPVGATMLDKDFVYNDGSGDVTYLASIGMEPSALSYTQEVSEIDNGEAQHLFPVFDLPFTEQDAVSGAWDYAYYFFYLVNYEDKTMGHMELSSGMLGQLKVDENGLSFFTEMTSWEKILKQSIVEKDSLKCRAIFGSQYPGTPGARVVQRFPCGADAESLWVSATVTAVGGEPNQSFTCGALGAAADTYTPGMVEWVTGANADLQNEVEDQTGAGVITLTFPTLFPIQVGDTLRIRHDCTQMVEGAHGCKANFASVGPNEWKLHFRGEPFIPVQNSDQFMMPGASLPRSLGGPITS